MQPETAKTTELVWEQDVENHYRLVISGYFYPIRGLISPQADPLTGNVLYQNSGRINMQGIEMALKRKARGGLEAGVSLSLQDVQNGGVGEPLTNSPHSIGQANLSVPLFHRKLFASADLEFVSRRKTLAGNYVGAYAVPNFTIFSTALRHWEVSASLYNAFNNRYGDPGAPQDPEDIIYQGGRNCRLKFTYRF